MLDQRALPLPVLRPITIGSDARNGIQLAHGSVKPFHARLKKRGAGIHIKTLDADASLVVAGQAVKEALLSGGEEVQVGGLCMRIDKGAIGPAVRSRPNAALSLEQEFQRLFLRELRRAPSLVISVLAHALLIWSLQSGLERPALDDEVRIIAAALDQGGDAMPAEEPEEIEESPPEELETEEELPEIDPFELTEEEETDVAGVGPLSADALGGASRLGVGGSGARGGFGGRGIRLEGVGGPLGERLRRFREQGLDVVFLIDTTASMELFLRAAKQTVDRMITDLAALIPNLRLGVVAYRDHRDDYVTHAAPLSTDRYGRTRTRCCSSSPMRRRTRRTWSSCARASARRSGARARRSWSARSSPAPGSSPAHARWRRWTRSGRSRIRAAGSSPISRTRRGCSRSS
ncbi:MAG: VWA domain-containing protein [Planctomycetes bacterium]|nr:VWA domain-containing protein [Planctomycetota bacterium]